MQDIIEKLKQANLKGRGGASFPTGLKWEAVKNAGGVKKYIVCNASEGEPDVFKDGFILENYAADVINGIKIALETIKNSSAYIYTNRNYYQKFGKKLEKLVNNSLITIFEKPHHYICGEETTIFNVIEGNRWEPKIKPPYPTESGLFGCPTLVNNVETFYYVSKIAEGKYNNSKFYSISGDVKKKGVSELLENWPIERILKETGNWPKFDFFIQTGGGAAGEILLPHELDRIAEGAGAIIVFNRKKTDPFSLMRKWAEFFVFGNCDKCVPCREGLYRIREALKDKKIFSKTAANKAFDDIFYVLEKTSFCPLGRSAALPFKSLIDKIARK